MIYLCIFLMFAVWIVACYKLDKSPVGDYGHIGQGLNNLVVILVAIITTLLILLVGASLL